MVVFDRPLVHTLTVAARPLYLTAVTVSRGTASADGVQNSSPCTQTSKSARSRHLVTTRTLSTSADFQTSIETKPANPWTWPLLLEERSTTSSAAPWSTGRLFIM